MPKIIAEIKNPKTGFWDNVKAFSIPLSGLVAVALITYTVIHDNFEDTIMAQETVISSLETRIDQISTEYQQLSMKTKRISELQLWKSEIITIGKEHLRVYGGSVFFSVMESDEQSRKRGKMDKDEICFEYTNSTENIRSIIRVVMPEEPFPFNVGEDKFILKFITSTSNPEQILAEIYSVKPLYITSDPDSLR